MSDVRFTALIRLPFARRDFVDPQQATWDASKDRELWRYISRSDRTKDLDWNQLADEFDVPPAFLLQQSAWLYERHLEHVRAQMKKVGVVARPNDDRRNSSTPYPTAPPLSRTTSTNTITQSNASGQHVSTRNPIPPLRQTQDAEQAIRLPAGRPQPNQLGGAFDLNSPADPASSSSSSSLSNSGSGNIATRSQLFKRPPRFRSQPPKELITLDEDTDGPDEPLPTTKPRIPFARTNRQRQKQSDGGSTPHRAAAGAKPDHGSPFAKKRGDAKPTTDPAIAPAQPAPAAVDASSSTASFTSEAPARDARVTAAASSSTASFTSEAPARDARVAAAAAGPISPNHRAELARLSPKRGAALKTRKEGSEGTPSMGSSFSDIDGTYIAALFLSFVGKPVSMRMLCRWRAIYLTCAGNECQDGWLTGGISGYDYQSVGAGGSAA
ncbi:hypothetical protein N0V90_012823 [Kalmusia sp. IMI 367209]|nr:hypothetical protein N0V90_012823 [Kalmusia sp. IMI 367209]